MGLAVTRNVEAGELLLCSLPLAVVYGAAGEPASAEEVADELGRRWPRLAPDERAWLALLREVDTAQHSPMEHPNGEAPGREPGPAPSTADEAGSLLQRAQALLHGEPVVTAPAVTSSAALASTPSAAQPVDLASPQFARRVAQELLVTASGAAQPNILLPSASVDPGGAARLLSMVQRYSYVEAQEDSALAQLLGLSGPQQQGGGGAQSVAGLFPEAALLNHSCSPAASWMVRTALACLGRKPQQTRHRHGEEARAEAVDE